MRASRILAVAVLIQLAGCGGSGGGSGSNSVNGPLGFNAVWAGSNVVPQTPTQPEILDVVAADTDLTKACIEAQDGGGALDTPGPVKLLEIGLASEDGMLTTGDYTIVDPSASQPPVGITRIALLLTSSYTPPGNGVVTGGAISGTVTLASFDLHNQKGSFDVTMTLPDGGSGGKLTGTFDATPCGPQG